MPDLKKAQAIHLFRKMCEIREFENSASENYRDGNMPGFIHLSIGQEACAVGACAALEPEDYITSTHRGHGHCLAKGADPKRMMAELFARDSPARAVVVQCRSRCPRGSPPMEFGQSLLWRLGNAPDQTGLPEEITASGSGVAHEAAHGCREPAGLFL